MTIPQQLAAFNYSVPPLSRQLIKNISAAYLVQPIDNGLIINCTSGTFTVSLTSAATLGSGFNCWIWNTGDGTVTIDPNASERISGRLTVTLRQGQGIQIVCDGVAFIAGDLKTAFGYAQNISQGATTSAPGSEAFAIGYSAAAPGSYAIALGSLNVSASGSYSSAIGSDTTASATQSTAIGRNSSSQGSQAVSGSGAMALGGSYASGTDSLAAAVANNTSSYGAKATGSIALGDRANAPGSKAIAIGQLSTSSGNNTIAIGGNCEATINYATAIGFYAKADTIGKYAYASNLFSATGDCQTGTFVLSRASTNNTPVVLTSDSSAPGTNDQIILPNNSAYAFTGTVVARQQASGGTASAAWKVEGLIRREGTAASTTLVASTVTAIDNTPGWTLALSADTTNGGLAVTATGAAATNIRWVATVQTSEVTYA